MAYQRISVMEVLGSSWPKHLTVLAALVFILIGSNWSIVNAALTVWVVSPTYSHCFFIIPVSAFFVWGKRQALANLSPAAAPAALGFAIPFFALQLAGVIFSITEVQQIGLVGLLIVLVLAVLGTEVFRLIRFPLLFLFFLVPMGEYLVDPMQRFTTWFISTGLALLGILHHTEGTVIELVGGAFRVAEACAGLRFLIATIAIGSLFCHLNFRRWYKIVLYMLASAIVPVIANGFRALGIVLLAHYSNNKIATGADHLVYGWGFSVLILCLLMFIGARFSDPVGEEGPEKHRPRKKHRRDFIIPTTVLALGIVIAAPAFAYWDINRPIYFDKSKLGEIQTGGDWIKTIATGLWSPGFLDPDAVATFGLQSKENPNSKVDLNLFYYARTRSGHGLIASTNTLWDEGVWHAISRGHRYVDLGKSHVEMEQVVLSSGQKTELVLWTYWVNGHFTTSRSRTKLGNLESVLGHGSGSALVALSTDVDGDVEFAVTRLESAAKALNLSPKLRLAAGIRVEQ
jgi:exosortase A